MDFDDFLKKEEKEKEEAKQNPDVQAEKKDDASLEDSSSQPENEDKGEAPQEEEERPWFEVFRPESVNRMEEGKSPDGKTAAERIRDLFFDVDGRLDRKTFCWRIILALVLCAIADVLTNQLQTNLYAWPVWAALVVLVPFAAGSFFSATVRRLHDIGRRGEWSILILAVPFLGMLGLLYLGWKQGTEGSNEYGSAPAGERKHPLQ